MATARISKRSVDSMPTPPERARSWLWDDQVRGFGVVMTSSGRRSYVLQYRVGGRGATARRMRIGTHGSPWTPDAARERALELLRLVEDGIDPALVGETTALADEEAERERAHFAFGAFADRFIAEHVVKGALRSRRDIEGTFDRDLRPWFVDRSVEGISKADIRLMLAHVGARSRAAANKAHKWLNRMYTWGMKHDRLETSPMFGLTKPHAEPKRDRFLDDAEIRLLAGVLPRIGWRFAALILLLLLTGQRLREVAGMRWMELDLLAGEWIIPGERTKNKRRHLVPLSSQAHRLLRAIRVRQAEDAVFVLSTTGSSPISGFSKVKALLDLLLAAAATPRPVPAWVVHDLRRTVATGCARLEVPIEHTEAVLNHVSGTRGGVAGTYNLYAYAKEKRVALQRWSDHVEAVVGAIVLQPRDGLAGPDGDADETR